MDPSSLADQTLDELAERAAGGDRGAGEELFRRLREMFLHVAKRRVQEEELEDVVQDALSIVHARHAQRDRRGGVLPWSLVVLRNVIGNRYQQRARRAALEPLRPDDPRLGVWDAGPEGAEAPGRVAEALRKLGDASPRCAQLFHYIIESVEEGGRPREITARVLERLRRVQPDMQPGNFHVRLHRCRARLRAILLEMEEGSSA